MTNKIEDRTKKVMSAVFEISTGEINDKSSPDNIISWDSIKHMNLVIALEEEFDIQFNDSEIVELQNLSLIINIIGEKF